MIESMESFETGKMLLIDKPLGWTSFDVIRRVRGLIKIKKVGHAGTLDPLATGLLIVCTGKYTKKINDYMAQEKEYTGTITLGAITDSFDLETEPEPTGEYQHLNAGQIIGATIPFIGDIMQVPPIHSALKVDGKRMYTLARKGLEVHAEARKVNISVFEITDIQLPVVSFRVVCSTGTYIRSLANDFGTELGCGGYLSSLRRTKIGEFSVNDAMTMEQFDNAVLNLRKGS
jgi:tRNA pseudouridine55 synthase